MSTDDHSLSPGLLVAAPKLEGGPFERAVILMVHHDAEGSMGFIINKTVDVTFGELLEKAQQPITVDVATERYGDTVYFGGPVRVEQLWVLFREEGRGTEPIADPVQQVLEEMDTSAQLDFHEDWSVAASGQVIEDFAAGEREALCRPTIGYTGWGPGQLEQEIEEGSWLACDFDESLLLETDPEDCWEAAVESMGIDATTFMMMGESGMA